MGAALQGCGFSLRGFSSWGALRRGLSSCGRGSVASRHVGSSPTRDRTCAPCPGSGFLTTGPPGKSEKLHLKKPAISCNLRSVTQHIQNTWDREAKSSQRFAAVGRLSLWFCLCKQTERFGVRLLPLRLGPFTQKSCPSSSAVDLFDVMVFN